MINIKNYSALVLGLFLFLFSSISIVNAQGVYHIFENTEEFSLSSDVKLLGEFDGRLLYTDVESDNNKLWVSDGTPEGTFKISAEDQTQVSLITITDDAAYFTEKKGDNYYISELVLGSNELNTIYTSAEEFNKIRLWHNDFYFVIDSATSFAGDDLIKYSPNSNTTLLLYTSDFGGIRGFGTTDSYVYFIINLDEGKMLGKTDGTLANTSVFYELYNSDEGAFLHGVMVGGIEKMFFFLKSGSSSYRLWVSNGTAEGTEMLTEYKNDSFLHLPTGAFKFFDGKFFFAMRDVGAPSGTTYQLHVSDGTLEGTFSLNGSNSGYLHPRRLTIFNDKLYFTSLNGNWALKATDGTVEGTETIISAYGYQSGSIGGVYDIGLYNDNLIMKANDSDFGGEIFISDGTLDGTTLLADIEPGEESSYPNAFTQVGDLLFFTAHLNDIRQLWVYDPNLISCTSFEITDSTVEDQVNTVPGSASVVVSGGQAPYSYQLNDGDVVDSAEFNDLNAGEYTLTITDKVGCSLTFSFTIEMVSDVLNRDILNFFKVYPNPSVTTSSINIEFELARSSKEILLLSYDMNGKLVYQKQVAPSLQIFKNEIPANSFTAGSYSFLLMVDGKIAATERITLY